MSLNLGTRRADIGLPGDLRDHRGYGQRTTLQRPGDRMSPPCEINAEHG
jgi:hypothetical protein